MRRLTDATVSYRLLLICALALLALLLAPVIYCGKFAALSGDDYSIGAKVHQAAMAGLPFYKVIWAAVRQAAETWLNWQGTFSGVFLLALSPAAVLGDKWYALTPALMLASLALGVFLLSDTVYFRVFGMNRSCAATVGAVALILCSQLLPSARECYYWYNGATLYTFIFGLALCAYSCGINYALSGGRWRIAALCLLAVLIGGGNYVTALSSAVIACCALLYMFIKKLPRRFGLALPTAVLLLSFLLSIAAPGNQMRQTSTWTESSGAVTAVLLSLKTGVVKSVEWMSLPLAGGLLFLAALFPRAALSSGRRFRYPLLVTALSYLLLSSMFCPHLYSLGSAGPGRLQNVIFFAYVLLLCFNLFYWIGWALRKRAAAEAVGGGGGARLIPAALTAAAAALLVVAHAALGGTLSSVQAVNLARSDEAWEYYAQTQQRCAILNDETVTDPVLEVYHVGPYLVYSDDISADPEYWVNKDMSSYYGKNSIRLAVVE